ncbi:lysosome membrane protein 2 [Hyalella azteca]|uniref:Scavenger receptor class B member 1 n=1 Tax=Hyalella azteca TaxID=294128 RepID=A0A8B7NSB1_HYAAZ|nr:lysosome membrane protein 2 [Hyalella azteca]
MSQWCVTAAILVAAVVMVVVGIVLPLVFPFVLNTKLDAILVLRQDSPNIDNFIKPPIAFQHGFYFFNVTNKDEILRGFKPMVVEVGPFFYYEFSEKTDIFWDDPKSTVSYRKNSTFYFVPHKSAGLSEDTLITTVNPIMLTLASLVEDMELTEAARAILEIYLWRFEMEPFITKPARELLFDGYEEPILRALSTYTKNPVHETGRFGYYYPKNQTKDVEIVVNTGAFNISDIMKLVAFDGHSSIEVWSEDRCNSMEGNLAAPFPRPITPERPIVMFSPALCRSIRFEFNGSVSMDKLQLYRYRVPYSLLAKTKENACYCTDEFTCRDSMAYLAPCRKGVPIMASYPHFYMGSEKDINSIKGLSPDEKKHETYLDVDPVTGMSLRAKKRVQINMPFRRFAELPALSKIQEVIFPILWMDQGIEAPKESTELLYARAVYPQVVLNAVCYTLIALGIVLCILTFIWILFRYRRRKPPGPAVAPPTHETSKNIEQQKPFLET